MREFNSYWEASVLLNREVKKEKSLLHLREPHTPREHLSVSQVAFCVLTLRLHSRIQDDFTNQMTGIMNGRPHLTSWSYMLPDTRAECASGGLREASFSQTLTFGWLRWEASRADILSINTWCASSKINLSNHQLFLFLWRPFGRPRNTRH